ncbi:MAG: hypothetical protein GY757_32685, partial [bacterium]|nr:hypothetical protein [bacterium]
MESLYEIQYNVEDIIRAKRPGEERSLWANLVQSSIKIDCEGCDGILIGTVQEHTEKITRQLNDKEMHNIWLETDNGILSAEQGFHEAHRCEMVHDIALDVIDGIIDKVCRKARALV